MGRESIQCEMKRGIVSTGKLEALDMRDLMEQMNKFMGDDIILKEGVIFKAEEDMGGIKHSSV